MNTRAVARMLGVVLLFMAGFMLIPAGVGFVYGETDAAFACIWAAVVTAAIGALPAWVYRGYAVKGRGEFDFFRREGLATAGLSWLVAGAAGALPYLFNGTFTSFVVLRVGVGDDDDRLDGDDVHRAGPARDRRDAERDRVLAQLHAVAGRLRHRHGVSCSSRRAGGASSAARSRGSAATRRTSASATRR